MCRFSSQDFILVIDSQITWVPLDHRVAREHIRLYFKDGMQLRILAYQNSKYQTYSNELHHKSQKTFNGQSKSSPLF